MTIDPRAEEIRARLDAATPGSWDATTSEATMNDRNLYRFGPQSKPCVFHAQMRRADADLIAHAPADLAYLLGRIETLEGGREIEQTMLRNGAKLMTDMADYQSRLRAERDRYRAVVDAVRSVDVLLPSPSNIDVKHRDQLAHAIIRLAAALDALDGEQT